MGRKHVWDSPEAAVRQSGVIEEGDALLLAVSGGADSTALLCCLAALRKALNLSLAVLHVNHGLRGGAAARDAAFVEALCAEKEILFFLAEVDVRSAAATAHRSIEDIGRELRYAALEETAERWGKDLGRPVKIVTAHTEEDAAETVLLQLARGSGLKGAAGIPARRGRIVRPLLAVSRREIEAYLARLHQPHVEDESNATALFARNRLRREILPRLCAEINPEAVSHLARAGQYFREADAYFEALSREKADRLIHREKGGASCDCALLNREPAIVQSYLLWQLLEAAGGSRQNFTARHTEALQALIGKARGKRLSLPQGLFAERRGERLVLFRPEGTAEEPVFSEAAVQKRLHARIFPYVQGEPIPGGRFLQWFDRDKMPADYEIRTRRPGDKLALRGGGHKSLRALMTEKNVPVELRERLPLLTAGGEIIWAIGLRRSALYQVDETTTTILELRYEGEET